MNVIKNKKKILLALVVVLVAVLALSACNTIPNSSSSDNQEVAENPATKIGIHHAEITVKDYGKITVELDGDTAPVTVANFVTLANDGFYDGLTFHRIMDGFMIQGGDPSHDGTGGSNTSIVGEFASNGIENNISHTKGTISMARRGDDKNSATSQFFIMVADADYLDGDYAAFGHVTEGQDIVDQIAKDAKPIDNNGTILFEEQPQIESIVIID